MNRVLAVSSDRVAAVCAGLLAVLSLAFALTNLLLPAGLYDDPAALLFQAGSQPGIYRLLFIEWAATGIVGLAVVGPVTRVLVGRGQGWSEWAAKLGYLAYAVTAVQAVHMITSLPGLGELYQGCHTCTASLAEQQTIAKWIYVNAALDPLNLIVAGGLGLWILGVSVEGVTVASSSRSGLMLGVVTGVLLIVVVVVGALNLPLNFLLLATTVLAAIWYAWVGILLYRQPATTAPA